MFFQVFFFDEVTHDCTDVAVGYTEALGDLDLFNIETGFLAVVENEFCETVFKRIAKRVNQRKCLGALFGDQVKTEPAQKVRVFQQISFGLFQLDREHAAFFERLYRKRGNIPDQLDFANEARRFHGLKNDGFSIGEQHADTAAAGKHEVEKLRLTVLL